MRFLISILTIFFGIELVNAQVLPEYQRLFNSQSDSLSVLSNPEFHYDAQEFTVSDSIKYKDGKSAVIAGCVLSLMGITMYASSWTMVSDGSSIGSVISIAGISCFAASIPFLSTGIIRQCHFRYSSK